MIEQSAIDNSFKTVKAVHLDIGKLSCIEVDALRFSFEAMSKNSIAQEAELFLTMLSAQAKCLSCKQVSEVNQYGQSCTSCGHKYLKIISGDEIKLNNLEVE